MRIAELTTKRMFVLLMLALTLVTVDVAGQDEGRRRGASPSGNTQNPQETLCRGIGRIQSAALSGFQPLDAREPPDRDGWRNSLARLPGTTSCRFRLSPKAEHTCSFRATPKTVVAQGTSLVRAVAACVAVPDVEADTIDFGSGFSTSFDAKGFRYAVTAAEPEKNVTEHLTLTITRQ